MLFRSDPAKFGAQTILQRRGFANEIAGDTVTGTELAAKFSRTAERSIAYHRFADSLLEQNSFLGDLARLVDLGRLAGNADVASLRTKFPGLLTMDEWLAGAGKSTLLAAIQADGGEVALR